MKTVFTSDEIPHLWANKSVPHGRSASALSFDGPQIMSYSTCMGLHVEHKGKPAIIINTRSYSVTTSKHQSWIRRAIPSDVPAFWYDGEPPTYETGKTLYEYSVKQAAEALAKAEKARRKADSFKADAAQWLERAKFINEFFTLRRKVDEKAIERLKDASASAARREKQQREAREAKERIAQTNAFEAWKEGRTIEGEYFNARNFPVAFRIEGDELVSTLGVRVPVREARVAHVFACKHRATGWHRNGETMTVGHYQLDSVTPNGVVAGCHRISWQEMERIAPMLASA